MTVDQDVITGEMVGGPNHRARTFTPGRVCAHPGCPVVLSIYNSRDRCSAHDFDTRLSRSAVHGPHGTRRGDARPAHRRHLAA